jgi:hypothetical protein
MVVMVAITLLFDEQASGFKYAMLEGMVTCFGVAFYR